MIYYKFLLFLFTCLFFISSVFSQERLITGSVKDSLNTPLESATLIASPLNSKSSMKYAITDVVGFYKLVLNDSIDYTITVSYLGYKEVVQQILSIDNTVHDFILEPNEFALDEIIIDYEYEAIEKNRDTITYNLSAFTNGNEHKMEDVLGKLPGVKIKDNIIKVNGERVTKLLVEGKTFFGGGTKLALENIPADVMHKIEIISDYTESELLKNIADENDLALNVVLKEDKKKFIFGEFEAGVGLDDLYILHPTFFKYSPKSSISFIGDINNFNGSSLSFGDLMTLRGGISSLLKSKNSSTSLFDFAINDKDKYKSTAKFSALNFHHQFNKKIEIEGYAIYSNNDYIIKRQFITEYIGEPHILETKDELKNVQNESAIVNIKANFEPNTNSRFTYGANYLRSNEDFKNTINSEVEGSSQFLAINDASNQKFQHYLEGFKKVSEQHTLGLAVNHSMINFNGDSNWISDSIFLEDYVPFMESSLYNINKITAVKSNNYKVLLKDYWILNNYYHLFASVGYDYKNSKIKIAESQILPNNSSLEFAEISSNFSNDLDMTLSDLNAEFGIKSKFGNANITFQISPHHFRLKLLKYKYSEYEKWFMEPKISVIFDLNKDEALDFAYNYSNRFQNAKKYLKNRTVMGYNSVFQGNPDLLDEKYHGLSLYYSNYISKSDFFIDLGLDYTRSKPSFNNTVIQNGINRVNSTVLLSFPETSLSFIGESSFKIKASNLDLSFSLDWSKINQMINEVVNNIDSYEYNFSAKWLKNINDETHLSFEFENNSNLIVEDDKASFIENIISLKFDSRFLKNIVLKTNASMHFINDYDNVKTNYIIPNIYVDYKNPNSKFSYGLMLENIFNNGVVLNNSFSNNMISSQKIFILPRVFLFKMRYKY